MVQLQVCAIGLQANPCIELKHTLTLSAVRVELPVTKRRNLLILLVPYFQHIVVLHFDLKKQALQLI